MQYGEGEPTIVEQDETGLETLVVEQGEDGVREVSMVHRRRGLTQVAGA